MNKKKKLLFAFGTMGTLLPLSLSNSPMPIYLVISENYAPTASIALYDDTSADLAVVELKLSNPTENLIALSGVYFVDDEAFPRVQSSSSVNASSSANSSSPSELYRWQGYPQYQKKMYLAPKSDYLPRYVTLRKTNPTYNREAETYAAIKAGKTIDIAFAGTVFATASRDRNSYLYSGVSLTADYSADTDQTFLEFACNKLETNSLSFNTVFYTFDYKGTSYQTHQNVDYEETYKTWVKGHHTATEFASHGIALYDRGNTLFSSSVNSRPYQDNYANSTWNWLYPLLLSIFLVLGVGLLAGLIVLLVWIST